MPVFNSNKHGIDTVLVLFDKEDPRYLAGTELTGQIVVKVEETSPVRGIKIKLFGRMDLYWRKVEGGNTIEFAEIEDYLDENVNVWLPNPRKKEEQWLFPGVHKYPFTYQLPTDIPESLEESRYGTVRYSVRATVYMTLGRMATSLEETFYIIGLPDPRVPLPADEDLPKENTTYATIGGTCFTGKTDVELHMALKKNVFKLGEKIPVHVECTIIGGSSQVDKVIVLLVQESIYICNLGAKEEERKKEILVMAEAIDEEDADSGIQNYSLELQIPDRLPLSQFPWCEFIQMGYFVHAVARTHSFYDDIVVKLPIILEPKDESAVADDELKEVVVEEPEAAVAAPEPEEVKEEEVGEKEEEEKPEDEEVESKKKSESDISDLESD